MEMRLNNHMKSLQFDKNEFTELFFKLKNKECAKYFNVSERTISKWSKSLNISKKKDIIKCPDEKEFKEYYFNHTNKECIEKYNISLVNFGKWVNQFNLHKLIIKKWTEEEINILKNKYSDPNIISNDILPNRGKSSVNKKANLLGLFRPTNEDILPKELTDLQHDIFIGTMLGDANLMKKDNKHAIYEFTQKYENKEYVDFIYESMVPFSGIKPKIRESPGRQIINGKVFKDYSKKTYSYRCRTKSHSIFSYEYEKWYLKDEYQNYIYKEVGNKGRKIKIKTVPRDLVLNERILAFWYFDDGSLKINPRKIILCTDGFLKEDNEFLVNILKRDLYFKKPILNSENRIIFNSDDMLKFIEIIKKHDMFKCFRNKKMNIIK